MEFKILSQNDVVNRLEGMKSQNLTNIYFITTNILHKLTVYAWAIQVLS